MASRRWGTALLAAVLALGTVPACDAEQEVSRDGADARDRDAPAGTVPGPGRNGITAGPDEPGTGEPRADNKSRTILARYALRDPGPGLRLDPALREVSGLTLHRGVLFAHADEEAVVHALDPATGRSVARYTVGRGGMAGDWEGVASAGGLLYLVDSSGNLLVFEPRDGPGATPPRRLVTGAGRICEVEGLDHDTAAGRLLLACKTPRRSDLRGHLVVLALSLDPLELLPEPAVLVHRETLEDAGIDGGVHPSAVAVDPASGALLVLAAREELLLTVLPDGSVGEVVRLDRRRMPQPEGLALAPDGTLYLASEGRGGAPGLLFVLRPTDPVEEAGR